MRHHHGSDGNESDGSVDWCKFSNDSDDSICRCDTQSSLNNSNCKIGLTCSREHHNDRFADNIYSPSGSGKLLQTKDSLEKVNATLRNRRISSGGSDTRKSRKDECARDRKVKNGWLPVDVRGQAKNSIQEYHCTKKDGASTYTCVIVKKIDLPKASLKSAESKGSKDCSYNMKGNEAPARQQEATPSTAAPAPRKPSKETNELLKSSASNSERLKKDLCSKCSMQTACSQHTTNTQRSPVATKSSVCSRGSLCSKNSVYSEESSDKEKSLVASKSYFSWVSSALKNTRDDQANKSKNVPPTDSQTGKAEYSKRSSISVCKSDSIKSICITESKIVTEVVKDVPVQQKSSQTDLKNTTNSNPHLISGDSKQNLGLHESQSNVCGKSPKSDLRPSPKLGGNKPLEPKSYVPPSCSKTTIQTSLASCFSRTTSKPNVPAQTPKSNPPTANSKNCLKKTSSKDSCHLKFEKSKSGTNNLGVKTSKIGFRTNSGRKITKRSVADKASQTDVTKRTKKSVQESKKACEPKSSEKSLCSQNSGHTTTLVFQPAPKRSLSVKSFGSKKSVCSLKDSKSKDKHRRSKKKAAKKSSVSSRKSAKSLRSESREEVGEMSGPSCSLSCKDSFMAAKNDPEIARTSCSIKSCDVKSKLDDDSSINYEDCLCEDTTCNVSMRPSSCRPKKGLLKKLFCRKTREERCIQRREKREKQKQKRREKEKKRREKERERERRERENEREREKKEREKECKRRRKEREKEKKRREKARDKEKKALEKEREKEKKKQEKARKEEEKRKAAEASTSSSSSDSLSC